MELVVGNWRLTVDQLGANQPELAERYNHVAPTWQRSIQRLGFIRAYESVFKRLTITCDLEHLQDNGRILDAGIGTGGLSQALMKVLPHSLELHGTDISGGMLDEAAWRLTQLGIRPSLFQQDIRERVPVKRPYDLIMTAHVLEHLPNPVEGLVALKKQLAVGAP